MSGLITKYELAPNVKITRGKNFTIIYKINDDSIIKIENIKLDAYCSQDNIIDIDELQRSNEEVFNYFLLEELIIIKDQSLKFPKMKYAFNKDNIFKNGIIDISKQSFYDLSNVILQFHELDFDYLQIRFLDIESLKYYNDLVNTNTSIIGKFHIELLIPYFDMINNISDFDIIFNNFRNEMEKFLFLQSITIYNSPRNELINNFYKDRFIYFTTDDCSHVYDCGKITENLFSQSAHSIALSHVHNSCLYNKLSVDLFGNIKNCPALSETGGNVANVSLKEAFKNKKIRKYWNTTKDKISICQNCEFRYLCTDCRAYLEDPNDELSKPLKCGYDLETGEWSDWSSNPLKLKTFEFYISNVNGK